jgi:hypothetical protein
MLTELSSLFTNRCGKIITGLMIFFVALIPRANAQNPPAGAIFDLATAHPAAFNGSVYTQFTTSFVATGTSEYVSFAFREVPSFFSLDDVSVTQQGSPTNLLADPGFESDTPANLGTNFPVGWGRWIQPIDTSAIGVVAGNGSNGGCNGPHTGTYFWCDGSVEGYDALYQQLNGLTPGATYNITFWLTDNSEDSMTNPSIDLLVYAGTSLPTGSQTIGAPPPATPIPSSVWLALPSVAALGIYQLFASRKRRA